MNGAALDPDSGVTAGVQTDGTLTIAVRPGGQPNAPWSGYTGWTRTRVTTGIENCPADFELESTDQTSVVALSQEDIQPGFECYITIGTQTVLTGYIDRVAYELTPNSHVVRVSGRSKCADLVDCSAEFSTFQLTNTNPLALATMLAKPFGIQVFAIGDIGNTTIPQFNVILTETAYEIIERVSRYAAILAYDDHGGNLILSRAGSLAMASGFTQGVNVQEAYVTFTMDERFSTIEAALLSTDTFFTQPGDPGDVSALGQDVIQGALGVDPGVPRFRPLIIVADEGDLDYTVAKQRCQWEVARRTGRSQAIRVICDSWFDSAGSIWQKNALAPVTVPSLKINSANWLIGSITYLRDEQGTRADVTLMPAPAFLPEPIVLQPYSEVVQAETQNGNAAATDGDDDGQVLPPSLATGGAQ